MNENFFNKSIEETEQILQTKASLGLKEDEVAKRQSQVGYNRILQGKKKTILVKFLEQFKDFMIIVLIIAAIISGVVGYAENGKITDSIIIMVVVIVNAIIGVVQENKAEKSLESLKKLSEYTAKVIRNNGNLEIVASSELVPGDIVVLETGDYIPADIRLIEAVNLKVQESALTGESTSVDKNIDTIKDENVAIGDRSNMIFSSSLVTYGRGKGIVVKTGMQTEVGKIAQMLNSTQSMDTPLQKRLNKLGKVLGLASIVICAAIFFIGILYGKTVLEMFMTSVSLAVAVIPEGLTAISTIVLAVGVQKMAKKNAIVKKLPAVETLGSSTVICSDKTGTLTQNKMTVVKLFFNNKLQKIEDINTNEENNELEKLVYISMLCNDTKVDKENKLSGDPTETALIDMGFRLDFQPKVFETMPRIKEIPFDSERKLMTTVNKVDDKKYVVYCKGGVDEIISVCSSYLLEGKIQNNLKECKSQIEQANNLMASSALRVLAMAYKEVDHEPTDDEMKSIIEQNLTFVGMCGMIDPPRQEAKDAVAKCKKAGIKTVMITGDHKITAVAIAKELGILENEDEAITGAMLDKMTDEELEKEVERIKVYARVSPEHKVRIVKALQKNNEVVAMTGDGVNDSPALKAADIGCSMGIVGTDVAKEAADVILTDDNFATIVSAVEEGRRIYNNILKAIQFLLSSNVGEVILLFVAILIAPILAKIFNIPVGIIEPLLPIHILWVNLVTDSLPALSLAFDPASKDVMKKRPIKANSGVFTKGMTWRIIYQGAMIGLLTLAAFIIGLSTKNLPYVEGLSPEEVRVEIGQTMAFIVLAFSELVHVFNIRNNEESIFKTGIGGNRALIGAILVSALLMGVVLFVPALRTIFSIPLLPAENIIETVILVFAPIVIVEIFKLLKINGESKRREQ